MNFIKKQLTDQKTPFKEIKKVSFKLRKYTHIHISDINLYTEYVKTLKKWVKKYEGKTLDIHYANEDTSRERRPIPLFIKINQ